jgi:ubiquinone/menaquinone biosynthesis C-methylase UbiE
MSEAASVLIPPEVVDFARTSIGDFFAPIARSNPNVNIEDFLDTSKSLRRAGILERCVHFRFKKVLEIGSGFGTNLVVWIKHFGIDGYGVEPGSVGFNEGFLASQLLLRANGIDPSRVINATGEALPFPDECFDVIYSANVLEHTEDPERVLAESLRVLRRGGTLHMEMPSFLSYFEGHYLVFQPPLFSERILPWLVQWVYRRDPAFARTLHTRINPIWCRRNVRELNRKYPVQLISVGEDIFFLDRLSAKFEFEMKTVASRLRPVMSFLQTINRRNWLGRLIVAMQGHYPLYLTVQKLASQSTEKLGPIHR